jgi:hypothetical protein
MAESKKKDGQVPEAQPIAADAKELTDESLENVAGGLGAAVPHIAHASSLKGPDDPCCFTQS